MHRYNQTPNLLLIGGPKTGTTSLMHWLRDHDSIFHPWPNESHFLMAGAAEFPTAPVHPRGTAIIAPEPTFHKYAEEPWILDKSAFHVYSERAFTAVRDQMPEARIIITLRNPIDLMLSMHQEHSKRLVDYNVSQADMLELAAARNFQQSADDPETWSFLAFPRLKHPTIKWAESLGDRVRIIPLSSIKNDPLTTLNDILTWLELEPLPENTKLPRHNEGGDMNPSGWAKFLRQPPKFLITLSKILLPSHRLRKAIFDPLRRPGFKAKAASRPTLSEELRIDLEAAFAEEIDFLANLESHIDSELIIAQ